MLTTLRLNSSTAATRRALTVIVVSLGAIAIIVPFVFMVSISLDQTARLTVPFPPRVIPAEFSWESYRIAIDGIKLTSLYVNTFEVAVGVIAISLATSFSAGYALSKLRLRGAKVILFLTLTTLMIPIESTMIPLFLLFKQLGLLNNYLAFYLPALAFPFGTFLVKQFMDTLPSELREAAIVDGAGELRVLTSVYFPLCRGVASTITILLFLDVWNSFLWPLVVLSDPNKYTVQLGIATFSISVGGGEITSLPSVNMATTVLSLLPVLAVYLFFQRYIVESIAVTGLKG